MVPCDHKPPSIQNAQRCNVVPCIKRRVDKVRLNAFQHWTFPSLAIYFHYFMITTAGTDVGLSDIEIQTWLDDNLNSYILGCYVHGIYTGLFGIAIWQLLAVTKISKARIYMGCIITVLYIFSMIYVAATWIVFSRAYVFATSFRARYNLMFSPVLWETVADTASGLNLIIADCTIIWRCWAVWAHDWRVTIFPIFFVIGGTFCGVNIVVHQFVASFCRDGTETNWAVATIVATLGTNILCTALIVGRIVYVARGHRGVMGSIRTYRGVLEIVVESAALYSTTFVVLMILYPLEGNEYMYPQALIFSVTGIAPTLIILRVASGQARPEESSHGIQSSLHFQTSRGSTIGTVTDGGEEDTRGTALVLSGSVEQV
ncbi:hypothetical protein ARMSODRAFT_541034 [Armillaria solidipes]|uniref:Uncharacterized protein n=1 Tax=Armillaria solidipes TaxID=1076256 RepID=A0A2H3BHP0_9AGAR|nr:hypothetical protein ARMSODRAFT_541034 [Armillaria solidipes]